MTSFVRFFGIKAITVGATLSITASLAFAQDTNLSKNYILNQLTPKPGQTVMATRSLSLDLQKQKEGAFLNTLRNRQTRSLSMDERTQLESLTVTKPNVNMEIRFDYNSASISDGSVSAVQHLGEALSDRQLAGTTFVLSGYTDAVGGEEFNQGLSERRADTIKQYLIEHFHIASNDLITVGYGKTHLADPTKPDDASNRRVKITNTEQQNAAAH
jgi:outer membrane protein OmpA-like peptidoglycan-associated protein